MTWREHKSESSQRILRALKEARARLEAIGQARSEPIAIVGIGCRFPGGVSDGPSYWRLLRNGADAVSEISSDRFDLNAYYDPEPGKPGKIYTRQGGFLDEIGQFDPQFFGISPREAISLDPQQRLLLEVSWEALENAGQAPDNLQGSRTGVFVGIGHNDYAQMQLLQCSPGQIDVYMGTGSGACYGPGRLSHVLGLRGPTMAVDTACSSSLLAVHLACQSLRDGECDLALVGGAHLSLAPHVWVFLSASGALAPDGRCKAFDAAADGFGRGEGCGLVVLRRLSDALSRGDRVQALIRGSAVNHDGTSSGLTVPSEVAQQQLLRQALDRARVAPGDVGYVETHGTGTLLGDPIEVESLAEVYGRNRSRENRLWIGSVKSNIGHLEAAAGIAGLIKVVLSLEQEIIPPQPHFRTPNPRIAWDQFAIAVPVEAVPWKRGDTPRFAGVSSFGMSGTNAHVLLEEAPRALPAPPRPRRPVQWIPLSANSPEAMAQLAGRYERHLAENPSIDLGDVAHTAGAGRTHFGVRTSVVAESPDEAREVLAQIASRQVSARTSGTDSSPPRLAFLFTGQGSQHANMGLSWYENQPSFRRALERCDAILRPVLERPLLDVIFPTNANPDLIHETAYTQPALFAWEYALARLLQSWGIQPAAVLGHSIGQYVAAVLAGVFSLEDGLALVAERARLMQALPDRGAMAAVLAGEADTQRAIGKFADDVSIAAVNAPRSTVISGRRESVARVIQTLQSAGVVARELKVSHAFHSALVEPMLVPFEEFAARLRFSKPTVLLVSNLNGRIASDEIISPHYWSQHARCCVRFADGVAALWKSGCRVFVEVGPRATLSGLARRCLSGKQAEFLSCVHDDRDDWRSLLGTLARLYELGIAVNWAAFGSDYTGRSVPLPTYPFQRQRYWFAPNPTAGAKEGGDLPRAEGVEVAADSTPDSPASTPAASAEDTFLYQLAWRRQSLAARPTLTGVPLRHDTCRGLWLLFADRCGVAQRLGRMLRAEGGDCRFVYSGEQWERTSDADWTVHPARPGDFDRLLNECGERCDQPWRAILHLWGCDQCEPLTVPSLDRAQIVGVGSVLHLVQALLRRDALSPPTVAGEGVALHEPPSLWLVTRAAVPGPSAVGPVAESHLAHYPLWGLGKVLSMEAPTLWGGMIDLPDEPADEDLAALVAEVNSAGFEDHVALRAGQRFVARLQAAGADVTTEKPMSLDPGATYLITGGLGTLGLRVTRWLVNRGARHLCLTGRRPAGNHARETICRLQEQGARVAVVSADVAEPDDVSNLMASIATSLPPLRGVVHAAGVLGCDALTDMDWNSVRRVLRPKVNGAWALHCATRDMKLDFFVCFSSLASVWGSKGQAHYAAANAFLDGLAHYRQSLGLPATSINWGPWSDGGMVSGEAQDWLQRSGVNSLVPDEALDLFGRLSRSTAPQLAVADVDWPILTALYQANRRRPLLDDVSVSTARPATAVLGAQTALLQQLQDLPAEDRRRRLLARLQDEVGDVLGFGNGKRPDPRKGFFKLGMDSLMAVELSRRLGKRLGCDLPSTIAFEHPNIEEMADFLGREVLGWPDDDRRSEPGERDSAGPGDDVETELIDAKTVPSLLAQKLSRLETLIRET